VIRAGLTSILAAFLALVLCVGAQAQTFGALARLLAEDSAITTSANAVDIELGLTQAVPFRVFTLAGPYRLVVDFREVNFGGWADAQTPVTPVIAIDAGPAREAGWSRLVLTLDAPFAPSIAAMRTDEVTGLAQIDLHLDRVSEAEFLAGAGAPDAGGTRTQTVAEQRPGEDADRFVVVLDPGHGGVDPGAVLNDFNEADLVLTFSRELRDVLRRTGRVDVVMTRETDVFVPLPTRVTLARAAGADVFISIHADAIAEGRARGATVYTLAETASDAAAAALAEQHDRADILQGVDLHGSDDVIAGVLMDLARMETAPRGAALADVVVSRIDAAGLRLHSHPRGEAGFTVLRAADIPSILVEIGFMSEGGDLENIRDPDWRAAMQAAITEAILQWADADAARMSLSRQ